MWLTKVLDRLQVANRRRKARWISEFISERGIRSVLLVGVGGPPRAEFEGLVERTIVDLVPLVVSSGLNTVGRTPYVTANGLLLPFRNQAFDLVFSNAVVEHVGGLDQQQEFIREHKRVGRHWVSTTPNRWFPIESHTRKPLRHWSPAWRAKQTVFTRLLSRGEFAEVCEQDIQGRFMTPTFTAWGSSLGEFRD